MRKVIAPADVDDFLDYVLSVAELVSIPYRIRPALRDPSDDRILEVAAIADAAIVTFNERDFEGAERHGVPILRPVEFLRMIGEAL